MHVLTDDEYSCLMIMKEGENLIRMKNTRWHAPLTSLYSKQLIRSIGNENFVISLNGLTALDEHEKSLDAGLGRTIEAHASINNARNHILAKLNEAKLALVEAARLGALTTGETEKSALKKCLLEVAMRAEEMLQ